MMAGTGTGDCPYKPIPPCGGGKGRRRWAVRPHKWHLTAYRHARLKCADCGACVVLRGVWFEIRGLPRGGHVSEKVRGCSDGEAHDWRTEVYHGHAYHFVCRGCRMVVDVRGTEYGVDVK